MPIFNRKKTDQRTTALVKKFDAIGDANRLKIIQVLSNNKEICVSEVAEQVGITTAGVSQHMKVLENAGLVERNRMGQKICYTISKKDKDNRKMLDMVLGR
ncbi:MAG: metalloregulator ArsR/SmtB family transcription factor [Candidatus Saccharimonadales bacterium]|nr:metalloregulator ArsR/SmtB family transcription factor [Candidatus Saccharimonadales bacterium]